MVIVWNSTGTFTAPSGTPPSIGGSFAGGTLLYNGTTSPQSHTGLTPSTLYYYKAWSYDGLAYSDGLTASATTQAVPLTLPYSQTFDGATIPANWTQTYSGALTSNRWSVSTTTNAGGTANEMMASYQNAVGVSRLIVGPITTTGLASLKLAFKEFINDYGAGVTYKIQSSSDLTTWTDEAWSYSSGTGDRGPETVNTTISNNVGSTTYIAWVLDGDHYQFDYWYVDDIAVTVPLPNDVGTSVINLAANQVPGSVVPQATVKNFGTSTNSFNVTMTLS